MIREAARRVLLRASLRPMHEWNAAGKLPVSGKEWTPNGIRSLVRRLNDGSIQPEAKDLAEEATARLDAGEPVAQLMQDWNRRGIPPVEDTLCTPHVLRRMLVSGRSPAD